MGLVSTSLAHKVNRVMKFADSDLLARIEESSGVTVACSSAFLFYVEFVSSSG